MDSKILIVDDDKSIRKGLSLALDNKYNTLTAEDGFEALRLCESERPDIVLLDVGLPEIDGAEVLKRLKRNHSDASVIMVTAAEDIKTIVKAIKLGAYDYLVKPIDSQELLLTIAHALENRGLKNQIRSIQQPRVDRYNFDLIGNNPLVKESFKLRKKLQAVSIRPC